MSDEETFSLWEALTILAFNRPTVAPMAVEALENCGWSCSRPDALTRLYAAVQTLCDAGYNGNLKIWGRPFTQAEGQQRQIGAHKVLDRAECRSNRSFSLLHDELCPGNGSGDTYADTFDGIVSLSGFDDVWVDRAELGRLAAITGRPTSSAEIQCAHWLLKEFEADSGKRKRKAEFKADALSHFDKKLSRRGFDRVWAQMAPEYARAKSGRPKLNQSTT